MAERSMGGRGRPKEADYDYVVDVVTPELATEWLGLCIHNRPVSRRKVQQYARDMAAGEWDFCGDPIRFDTKGNLIDGRHRLLAMIEANHTCVLMQIRGLPTKSQEKLDQGRIRSASDYLALRNYDNSARLAATARVLFRIKHRGSDRAWGRPTNTEVLKLVDKHQRLTESADMIGTTLIGINPSLIGGIHYIGARLLRQRETADQFVSVFTTGQHNYVGDPVHAWREWLIGQQKRHERLRVSRQTTGTIHAWNLFAKGEKVERFRLPEDDEVAIEGLDVDRI